MSYAELISRLSALPVERRVQLFDFKNLFEFSFDLLMDDPHPDVYWPGTEFCQIPIHDDVLSFSPDGLRTRLH